MDKNNTQTETTKTEPTESEVTAARVETEIDDAMSGALDSIEFEDGQPESWGQDNDTDPESGDGTADEGDGDGDGAEDLDPADPDPDDDADPDAEALDETPQVDRADAIDALIASGKTPAQVQAMSEDDILAQGAELLEAQANEPETEPEPEEEQPTVTDEELFEAIGEELGDDFSGPEKEKIGKAIAKAIDLKRYGKFDFKPFEDKVESQVGELKGAIGLISVLSAEVEALSTERSISKLAEAYPQLEDESNAEKVKERAAKYMSKSRSLHEAMEMAAFTLFGKEQTHKIAKHTQKVQRAKQAGKPTKRASVARDNKRDEVDEAAAKAVDKHFDL